MYLYYTFEQSDFNNMDYMYSSEEKILVMLPHGSQDGRMFNRAGDEISDATVISWANFLRDAFAKLDVMMAEEISIAIAPCYPIAVRQKVKSLEILGGWNGPTYADEDSIGMAFVIKPWHCTVRAGSRDC